MSRVLHELTLPELVGVLGEHGLSSHQARLTFQAIHRHGQLDPEHMPGISDRCRMRLQGLPPIPRLILEKAHQAQDGTIKLRVKTLRGDAVEAVIIPILRRLTLCLSCQVGCAAACSFCRTGTLGLQRNLEAWEMLEQVRLARAYVSEHPLPGGCGAITNLVFMGMGEPLHNEANVVQACRILNDDLGAGCSRRHIVMSSAGVGSRLRAFWEANVASLAVSLHATTDEVRDQLVPLNRKWNVAALRQSLLAIPWRRGETVMIAYLLLAGINDSQEDAQRLAQWCKGLPAKVNLLEFNEFPGSQHRRCSQQRLGQFRQWLHDYGVFHTLRLSRGNDVLAACGQLAQVVSR